jgi:hypothetical protein
MLFWAGFGPSERRNFWPKPSMFFLRTARAGSGRLQHFGLKPNKDFHLRFSVFSFLEK